MREDLSGKKFNRLTVIRHITPGRKSLFRCDCGVEKLITTYTVTNGKAKSCGCLRDEFRLAGSGNVSHGESRYGVSTPEYKTWRGMISRCYEERRDDYADYGARGIIVCAEWRDSFEAFLKDMGRRPSPAHSIGRKDNDGNYSLDNCEWQTPTQQARNRRSSRFVTALGKTLTLAGWQDETGINQTAIWKRISRGWSPDRAVSEPITRDRRA